MEDPPNAAIVPTGSEAIVIEPLPPPPAPHDTFAPSVVRTLPACPLCDGSRLFIASVALSAFVPPRANGNTPDAMSSVTPDLNVGSAAAPEAGPANMVLAVCVPNNAPALPATFSCGQRRSRTSLELRDSLIAA